MLDRMQNVTPLLTITEGRTLVSPQMAAAILNATPYKGQRPLKHPHVDKWVMMIVEDRGEFLRDQGVSFGRLTGILYLLNGQHRLNAVVKSGRSVSFDFTIYECRDEADLQRHYARFDSESLSRSMKDIVANSDVLDKDMNAANFARLCDAMTFIETRFKNISPRKMPAAARLKERRMAGARSWLREARLYLSFKKGVSASQAARFYAAAPLAVAIATLRYQPEQAEEFWRRAIRNDGLYVGDPEKALVEAYARRGAKWTRYQVGHLAAVAWNAAFEERDLKIIRLPKEGEIYIAGTPY